MMLLLLLAGSGDAQPTGDAPKYYRTEPGQNGEYFDTRTMQWYTANGQLCNYCSTQSGYGVPMDQINQGTQRKYAFADGFFFSPYELAWFDRNCVRCEPASGFWIPDEFADSAEYRKERRRYAQFASGPMAPLPDGRPANAPRLGALGQGGFGQSLGTLPVRFDPRQMRWVDGSGQICPACTPENGFWIPPQFSREPEFQTEQQRYASLIGSMRREVPPPANGYGNDQIECSSQDGRYQLCRMDTGRSVTLVKQLSKSACVQNQSWGYTREGIWVDRGCRARFQIVR
jgi:hypothetical protein